MNISNSQSNHSLEILMGSEFWNSSLLDDGFNCDHFMKSYSTFTADWFQGIIYFFYSAIFVVALTGNGLVCYVVLSSPRMKTVTNFFIANLALGDILMTLFCVPPSFISILILQYWPFGPELCPIVNYLQAVSVLVSAYTLVAISIDRYIAIMWPLRPRFSKRQALLLILAVWLLAMVISFPIAVVSRLSQPSLKYELCDKYICDEVWPSENRYSYSIALLVLQYVIPIMVLMFTYTSIAIMVWGKRPPGEAENVRDQRIARSKRKMVKMMVTVVIVFTVCWLPLNVLNLIMHNNETLGQTWSALPFVWASLHWLAMSHSCYNPVIYCWMNAKYRSSFLTAIRRLPGVHQLLYNDRRRNNNHNASMIGVPLTGLEGSNYSVLRRMNTCTTYVSVHRKTNGSHSAPARSASFRNDSFQPTSQQSQRKFTYLKSHSEEQL